MTTSRKEKKEVELLIIIGFLISCVFVTIYAYSYFGNLLKPEREQNQRIEQSIKEAREIEKEQFCTRYIEYTEKDQAPYAYRYCWNYKSN